MKKLYFDSQLGVKTYALKEDGVLTEYTMEYESDEAVPGNIYKGRVTDVLNGMQAAFIDCGLERHCYISAADLSNAGYMAKAGFTEMPQDLPALPLNLKVGQELLVQVTKAPTGKKGARVTTNLSFVGRYLVYLPGTSFIGVSHKISDDELKKNLIFTAKQTLEDGEGLIVRTAAPYALMSAKLSELNYLRAIYNSVKSRFASAACGELLYRDSPMHMCVLRDIRFTPADEIHVGSERFFGVVKDIVDGYSEGERPQVVYHDECDDMLYSEGVSEEYLKTLKPKAELANGSYIVIDRTEALTAIDVNTGKYTGEDNLESTAFSTNLLAVKEIARQVRLRDIGGIIVVDFIDMREEKHKKQIVGELEHALKNDNGKCCVAPMSKFGLVEFTRKRTRPSASEIKIRPCKACDGTGALRSMNSLMAEFRAKLVHTLYGGASTVCADLNFDLANYVLGNAALKGNLIKLYPQARVYIIGHRTYKETTMSIRRVDTPNFTLPEGTMQLY